MLPIAVCRQYNCAALTNLLRYRSLSSGLNTADFLLASDIPEYPLLSSAAPIPAQYHDTALAQSKCSSYRISARK